MAEIKASNLIFSILIVSLMVGVFMGLMARSSSVNGLTYDNNTYATYQQLEAVTNNTREIQVQTEKAGTSTGAIDILGGFFKDGYQAIKLTKNSYNTLGTMTDAAATDIPLGSNANLFKQTAKAAIIVLIFISIILAAIIKSGNA